MNIAEILKNCPKGMKLYSPIFGEVEFGYVSPDGWIKCYTTRIQLGMFYPDGTYSKNGECMLFPSQEQRDWNKFLIPFKDGDIIITVNQTPYFPFENIAIFKEYTSSGRMQIYCQFDADGEFTNFEQNVIANNWRKATDKERQEFFEKLHKEGYDFVDGSLVKRFKYGDIVAFRNETYRGYNIGIFDEYLNDRFCKLLCVTLISDGSVQIVDENYKIDCGWDTKDARYATHAEKINLQVELAKIGYEWKDGKLVKVIKPKFKVGDIITSDRGIEIEITSINDGLYHGVHYKGGINFAFPISKQDFYHLAKFDITSLQPYDRVLVRDPDGDTWYPTLVSFVTSGFVYVINRDEPVYEVIPFEGHEHLIGLSEDPNDYYITWE